MLRVTIAERGVVAPAAVDSLATLTVTLKAGVFFSLPLGTDHMLREVEMSGNERLANEVLFLARNLRWDIEEDLSRVFGDALAHRLVAEAKSLGAAAGDSGRRLAQALMEYVVEERSMLARREEHEGLALANARLRDGIERLEQRLERLGNG
jgi:ubiquinone biosynthesis protein UbiJ